MKGYFIDVMYVNLMNKIYIITINYKKFGKVNKFFSVVFFAIN